MFPSLPPPPPDLRGEFLQIPLREKLSAEIVAEHANVPFAAPAPALAGPTRGIFANSATNEKNWQRLRISSSAVSCGNGS